MLRLWKSCSKTRRHMNTQLKKDKEKFLEIKQRITYNKPVQLTTCLPFDSCAFWINCTYISRLPLYFSKNHFASLTFKPSCQHTNLPTKSTYISNSKRWKKINLTQTKIQTIFLLPSLIKIFRRSKVKIKFSVKKSFKHNVRQGKGNATH